MTIERTKDNYIYILWDEESKQSRKSFVPIKICRNFKRWFDNLGISFDKIDCLLTEIEKNELSQW